MKSRFITKSIAGLIATVMFVSSVPEAALNVYATESQSENEGFAPLEDSENVQNDAEDDTEDAAETSENEIDSNGDGDETLFEEETDQNVGLDGEDVTDGIDEGENPEEIVDEEETHNLEYTDNLDGTHFAICLDTDENGEVCTFVIEGEEHTFVDGVCVCGAIEVTGEMADEEIAEINELGENAAMNDPQYEEGLYNSNWVNYSNGKKKIDEITVHVGETVSVGYPDDMWEFSKVDYKIEAVTSATSKESAYEIEEAKVYLNEYCDRAGNTKVCVKGLKTSSRYLRLSIYSDGELKYCIPVNVLPAASGAKYVTPGEITVLGEDTTEDSLVPVVAEILKRRSPEGYDYVFIPTSVSIDDEFCENKYDEGLGQKKSSPLFTAIFAPGNDQMGNAKDEGDYLAVEGLSTTYSYAWSVDFEKVVENAYYRGENYDIYALYHDKFDTTYEQEQKLSADIYSLCHSGELAKYQSSDRYTQVKACVTWVEKHNSYSTLGNSDWYYLTAHSAYYKGKSDCRGYALLLYRLLREFDIPVRIIERNTGSQHIWNLVYMEDTDRWYSCDASKESGVILKGTGTIGISGCADLSNYDPAYKTNIRNKISKTDYSAPKTYTVTYNANGGKCTVKQKSVVSGKTYGELPSAAEVTRAGYMFDGWFTKAIGGTQILAETQCTITANQTLYAHWAANTYKLKFNLNDSAYPNISEAAVFDAYSDPLTGEDIALTSDTELEVTFDSLYPTLPTANKEHCTFAGWFTDPVDGIQIKSSAKVAVVADTVLYAHWDIDKLNVTFHVNADGATYNSGLDTLAIKADYNTPWENLTYEEPQNLGKSMLGWAFATGTDDDGNPIVPSVADDFSAYKVTDDVDVYAVWNSSYNRQVAGISAEPYEGAAYEPGDPVVMYSVNPGTKVSFKTSTPNAVIYYAVTPIADAASLSSGIIASANEPSKDNIAGIADSGDTYRYIQPISITEPVIIKVYATKSNFSDSDVFTYLYNVNDMSEYQGDVVSDDLPGNASMTLAERVALIPSGFWVSPIDDQIYTGKALKPALRVYNGTKLLNGKTEYSVTYKNNINAGTATVTVTGKGGYTGSCVSSFIVRARDISPEVSALALKVAENPVAYNAKKTQAPSISFKINGKTLKVKTDYTVSIVRLADEPINPVDVMEDAVPVTSCKEPGTYRFTVAGRGNYTAGGYIDFTILPTTMIPMSALTVVKISDQIYGAWYDAENNRFVDPTTVDTAPVYYTLLEGIRPAITLKDSKGNIIDQSEYDVTYSKNTSIGTATIKLTAKSESTVISGARTVTFRIVGYPMGKVSVTDAATGKDISKVLKVAYTGSAIKPMGEENVSVDAPETIILTYKSSKTLPAITLEKGKDYTVSYKNNIKTGTATITFSGKGEFTGTLKKTFTIKEYVAPAGDNIGSHLFVEYLNPDNVTAEGINEYKYIKGGVSPKLNIYYDPEGGITSETTLGDLSSKAVLLKLNTDYTLKYANNKAVGQYNAVKSKKSIAPAITVTGKKSFKGSVVTKFSIVPRDISEMNISIGDKTAGSKVNQYALSPVITDKYVSKNNKLAIGTDYNKKLQYTYDEQVKIYRYNSKTKRSIPVIVDKGTTVGSSDIVPADTILRVTATGIKNYTGTISTDYRVTAYDISKATVKIKDQIFSGEQVKPDKNAITSVSIKIGKNTIYLSPEDYEITGYGKNNTKGSGSLTIHGTGAYGGYKKASFKINARSMNYTIAFRANGGSGTMKNQVITKVGQTLNANAFKRTGYEFVGWNTVPDAEADPSGTAYSNKQTISDVKFGDTLVLYAQWKEIHYTIKFVANSPKGINDATATGAIDTVMLTGAQKYVLPKSGFSLGGYTISGWNTKANGKGTAYKAGATISGIATTDGQVITLYAQWTPSAEMKAYRAMIAYKSKYPEGTHWDNSDFYAWKGGIYYGGYGCAGFAFMLSDAAFGSAKAKQHTDFSKLRVGDIVRVRNSMGGEHSIIVLWIDGDKIYTAEGNYNSSVHWCTKEERVIDYSLPTYGEGKYLTKSELKSKMIYIMTRW